MLIVKDILVSDDIIEQQFVCNLEACKGACCWEGDWGAPLTEAELKILEDIQEYVTPYLSEESLQVLREKGPYTYYEEPQEYGTSLLKNGACVYMIYDEKGIAKCGLEEAYNHGATDWKKPISCHLYPIRTRKYSAFTAVNYHKWAICDPACSLGEELKVPVYKFVKEALVRKFGQVWYNELELVAKEHLKQ